MRLDLVVLVNNPESNNERAFVVDDPKLLSAAIDRVRVGLPDTVWTGYRHGGMQRLRPGEMEALLGERVPDSVRKQPNPVPMDRCVKPGGR